MEKYKTLGNVIALVVLVGAVVLGLGNQMHHMTAVGFGLLAIAVIVE